MAHFGNFQLCVYFAGKNIKNDQRNIIRNDNNNNNNTNYDNNDPNASDPNANEHVNINYNYGNNNIENIIIMSTMITK